MKKISVIAVMTIVMIFAASRSRLAPIYASPIGEPASVVHDSGNKALRSYLRRAESIYNAGISPLAQNAAGTHSAVGTLAAGGSVFQQNCAFCHGRDAGGGESGPDLTRSKLVASDHAGDKISEVVRNGRTEGDKKMPAFKFSDAEMAGIVAFIHDQTKKANAKPGGRRGVDVADLQTGNAAAGKQYFEGAGGCSSCHSPTGDLAHVASRYEGLQLEQRMLYPRGVKSKITVTLPSGEKVTGTEAYLDEFTVGLIDKNGTYRSWSTASVKYSVESPVDAHVAQFPKYTDADIHNLMAYIQTLR